MNTLYCMPVGNVIYWAWGKSIWDAAVCIAYRMGNEVVTLGAIRPYGVK